MRKAVILFALAACAVLAGPDRAVPATSNLLNASGGSSMDGSPAPMCPPTGCPLLPNSIS